MNQKLFILVPALILILFTTQTLADAHNESVPIPKEVPKHKKDESCPPQKTCIIFDGKYIPVQSDILKKLGYTENQILTPNQMILLNYRRLNGHLESNQNDQP